MLIEIQLIDDNFKKVGKPIDIETWLNPVIEDHIFTGFDIRFDLEVDLFKRNSLDSDSIILKGFTIFTLSDSSKTYYWMAFDTPRILEKGDIAYLEISGRTNGLAYEFCDRIIPESRIRLFARESARTIASIKQQTNNGLFNETQTKLLLIAQEEYYIERCLPFYFDKGKYHSIFDVMQSILEQEISKIADTNTVYRQCRNCDYFVQSANGIVCNAFHIPSQDKRDCPDWQLLDNVRRNNLNAS